MNEAEQKVMDLLVAAWNAFTELPVEHQMDNLEFCQGIHRLQEKILAREPRRLMNGKAIG